MAGLVLISHRRGTVFHLRWAYGADLRDVEITAVVSVDRDEIDRLKVMRRPDPGEIDLLATAAQTALWPAGQVAIDIQLRRGSTSSGRCDTFFVGMT